MRALMRSPGPDPLRRRGRPGGAVPAGAHGGQHAQRLRRPQERAQAHHLPAPGPRADPERHPRPDDLPGVGACGWPRQIRRLLPRGGRQPAQGLRQEDPRADRRGAREVRRRLRGTGYGEELGTQLFDIIEPFADYAFNKSHAYGYGLVAYQTAWLKAHHPVEYMAACSPRSRTTRTRRRCTWPSAAPWASRSSCPTSTARGRVRAGPVRRTGCGRCDVPRRRRPWRVRGRASVPRSRPWAQGIVFGLAAVRNVGESLVERIVAEREANGPFADIYDFCRRVDPVVLNKRTMESLVKAGAFDSLGHPRQGLCLVLEAGGRPHPGAPAGAGPGDHDALRRLRGGAGRPGLGRGQGAHPRHRVRQGPAAGLREGDARAST